MVEWFDMMSAVVVPESSDEVAGPSVVPSTEVAEPSVVPSTVEEPAVAKEAQLEAPGAPPEWNREHANSQKWIKPIQKVLKDIIKMRGRQIRPYVMSSGCCGTVAERSLQDLGVRVQWKWLCDPKKEAFNFNTANGPSREHYFSDLDELSRTGRAWCFDHEQICEASNVPGSEKEDVNLSGLSCRPVSTSNNHRKFGVKAHPEGHLFSAWLRELKRTGVQEAWLENVLGILVKPHKDANKTVLQEVLEEAQEELPKMDPLVLFVDGADVGKLPRRRVFLHLLHEERGGRDAHNRMANYYKAVVAERQRMPKPMIGDLLFADDHPKVLAHNEKMAATKPYTADRNSATFRPSCLTWHANFLIESSSRLRIS